MCEKASVRLSSLVETISTSRAAIFSVRAGTTPCHPTKPILTPIQLVIHPTNDATTGMVRYATGLCANCEASVEPALDARRACGSGGRWRVKWLARHECVTDRSRPVEHGRRRSTSIHNAKPAAHKQVARRLQQQSLETCGRCWMTIPQHPRSRRKFGNSLILP
eukprot:6926318-Prymnesium_polylepis.3